MNSELTINNINKIKTDYKQNTYKQKNTIGQGPDNKYIQLNPLYGNDYSMFGQLYVGVVRREA